MITYDDNLKVVNDKRYEVNIKFNDNLKKENIGGLQI